MIITLLYIVKPRVYSIRFLYTIKFSRTIIYDRLELNNVMSKVMANLMLCRFIIFVLKMPLVETYNIKINKYTNRLKYIYRYIRVQI